MTCIPRRARNSIHLFASMVRKGEYTLTETDKEDLRSVEVWARRMRKGESLDKGETCLEMYSEKVV